MTIIIGIGGHAKSIAQCIEYYAMREYAIGDHLPNEEIVVGIGDNKARGAVADSIKGKFATVIHPTASVSKDVEIGEGAVILAGAIVNSGAKIGRHCIINTGAVLEHDSVMGDYSSLAPEAATGGNVHIGKYTSIGMGAIIRNGVKIGMHTVIGMGAVVTKDFGDFVTAYGNPCKEQKKRKEGEKYL